jgi:hypothetical protein
MEENKYQIMLAHISTIREERDTQKRMELLLAFNDSLPNNLRIQIPSFITNAYVRQALDVIEERISLLALAGNSLTSSAA